MLLPVSGGCRHFLAQACSIPTSCFHCHISYFLSYSLSSLCLPPLRTFVIILGSCLDNPGQPPHLKILNVITRAESLCHIRFQGYGPGYLCRPFFCLLYSSWISPFLLPTTHIRSAIKSPRLVSPLALNLECTLESPGEL